MDVIKRINPNKRVIYASSQRVYAIREREDVQDFLKFAYNQIEAFIYNSYGLSIEDFKEKSITVSKKYIKKIPLDVNIYDVTKLLGEIFVKDMPNYVIARISNAYGPDYKQSRLINRLIKSVINDREISEINESRDFIYQDDLNKILLALANSYEPVRELDVASGLPVSMENIKGILTKLIPKASSLINITGSLRHTSNQNSNYSEMLLGRKFTDIDTGLCNVVDSYTLFTNTSDQNTNKEIIVMDIGGTTIRIAVFGKDEQIKYFKKVDAPNFMRVHGDIIKLQEIFIETIKELILTLINEHPNVDTNTISIAFPGPVNNKGIITSASTLWGEKGENIKYNISKALTESVPIIKNIYVLNDNSAATLRYAKERTEQNISVVTVSSGISNNIYFRQHGGLLMNDEGLTGEIGHLKVDFSDDAPIDDSGGKGYLSAISSGRGAERMAQRMAALEYRQEYATSYLYSLSGGVSKAITNCMLVEAIHRKDYFALMVLDRTTFHLADILANITVANSIDKIIIVGGFAQAVGQQYIDSLNKRLLQHDFYGRDVEFSNGLVELGRNDGLDNLIGMGYYANEKINAKRNLVQRKDDVIEINISVNKIMTIYFTRGVFNEENILLASLAQGRQIIVFVDKNVIRSYGDEIEKYFYSKKQYFVNCNIHIINGNEASKTVANAIDLINTALENRVNRKAVFIAIGGGAMMDTVGFAAQLYRRGVDYIRVPTTLLSIIDAAVGIKVGVNYNDHKNLLGAFYPPLAVISDTGFIKSLDARQLRGGIAEILKVAIISNIKLFENIEKNGYDLVNPEKLNENPYKYEYILKEAALELAHHLEKDLYEHELKRHVDFGHTFAHTFEDVSHYELTHGEAVGIDMLISSHIAYQRGLLSMNEFGRIIKLYRDIGLPIFDSRIDMDVIRTAIDSYTDHKGGKMLMVIPKEIGRTQFTNSISQDEINKAINYLKKIY